MSSLGIKRTVATALTGAAIASSLAAPAVSAFPIHEVAQVATRSADSQYVPPPPSSIAASAAEEYEKLRARGATPADSQPVVDEPSPSEGFDVASAAIGAAAGTGVLLLVLTAGGLARRRPMTRRHGTIGA